jgi:hypothetical protein
MTHPALRERRGCHVDFLTCLWIKPRRVFYCVFKKIRNRSKKGEIMKYHLKLNLFILIIAFAFSIFWVQPLHASPPTNIPGVTGGPFGNSTQVGQFTVKDGKVVSATNVDITLPTSLPPSGAAGGDLSGDYPNPAIRAGAVTGEKLAPGSVTEANMSSGSATEGQVLTANGSGGANWSDQTLAPVTASLFNAEVNGEIILDSSIFPNTEVASVQNLMPGNYSLMATVTALMGGQPNFVRCSLTDQNKTDFATAAVSAAPVTCLLNGCFLNMTIPSVRQDPGNVSLKCSRVGDNTSSAKVLFAYLVATKVGPITCTGNGCQSSPIP